MSKRNKSVTKLILAMVVGITVGWALSLSYVPVHSASPPAPRAGQDRVIPASASPPPFVQEMEARNRQVPNPPARGTAGPAVKALQASPEPPRFVREREAREQNLPQPPRGKSTTRQLEQILSQRPDAAAKMQRARAGGRPSAGNRTLPPTWWDRINPFRVLTTLAQSGFDAFIDARHDNASHYGLYDSATNFFAYVYGGGVAPRPAQVTYHYVSANGPAITLSDGSTSEGFVYGGLNVPADGYYIVNANILAYSGARIRLATSGRGWEVLHTFDAVPGSWADYPEVLYLAAGSHNFVWVPGGTSSYFYFQSAIVRAFP